MLNNALEARVGVFVAATLALLIGFIYLLGDYRLGGGMTIYADFHFSGSLGTGAAVKVSGIKIGKITALQYVRPGELLDPPVVNSHAGQAIQVRATIQIDKNYTSIINNKCQFIISQSGMFGEPFLEMIYGDNGAPVHEGALFRGHDAVRLDMLLTSISDFASGIDFNSIDFTALGSLLQDGSSLAGSLQRVLTVVEPKIPELLDNANTTITSFKTLADNGNRFMADNGDLSKTLHNVKDFSAKLNNRTDDLLDQASDTLAAVKKVEPLIAAVNPAKINKIIDTTENTMNNLQNSSNDLSEMLGQVKSGQGTIGALLTNPDLYNDIKDLVQDIKQHPWKVLWRK